MAGGFSWCLLVRRERSTHHQHTCSCNQCSAKVRAPSTVLIPGHGEEKGGRGAGSSRAPPPAATPPASTRCKTTRAGTAHECSLLPRTHCVMLRMLAEPLQASIASSQQAMQRWAVARPIGPTGHRPPHPCPAPVQQPAGSGSVLPPAVACNVRGLSAAGWPRQSRRSTDFTTLLGPLPPSTTWRHYTDV